MARLVDDMSRGRLGLVTRLTDAAGTIPVRAAYVVLGVGVVIGRRLARLASRLCPFGTGATIPQHHAGRVRARAREAERAARASGLLARRDR
jgi:hypothetical protein